MRTLPQKAKPAAKAAKTRPRKPAKRPASAERGSHLAGFNEAIHDPLESSIPFLLRRTTRCFRLGMQHRMREHGLGFSHWFFLRALWLEDGITQRELCRRIEAAEPAAVTALRGLERGGYIRRVRDKNNLRQVHIFMTPKGRALRDVLLPYAFEIHRHGLRGISKRERDIVRSVLNRIRSNMADVLNGDTDIDGRHRRLDAEP